MKKSKLLMPVLSIAGLGAVVAPVAAMTSCSCNPQVVEPETLELDSQFGGAKSKAIEGDLKTNTTYQANFQVFNPATWSPKAFGISKYVDENPIPLKTTEISEFKLYKVVGDRKTEVSNCQIYDQGALVDINTTLEEGNYLIQFKISKEVKYTAGESLMFYVK